MKHLALLLALTHLNDTPMSTDIFSHNFLKFLFLSIFVLIQIINHNLQIGNLLHQHKIINLQQIFPSTPLRQPSLDRSSRFPNIFTTFILNFSLNFCNHLQLPPYKHRMIVIIFTLCPLLRKSIHIQLSNKRMHVVMFEIDGKNIVSKIVLVADYETCILLRPVDYVIVLGFLYMICCYLKDLVCFQQECWSFFMDVN